MNVPSSDSVAALGIDVGGTWVRAALVATTGEVLCSRRRSTPEVGDAAGFIHALAHLVRDVLHDGPGTACRAVGLALPGLLDADRVRRCVNIPCLEGTEPGLALAAAIGRPVAILTDADAAALGEWRAGASGVARRFVHLRLGTGIACSLIDAGRPVAIQPGRTRHLDVLVVDESPAAVSCPCGLRGCLESTAGGRALDQRAKASGFPDGLPELQSACAAGNATAGAIIADAAEAVVRALQRIAAVLSPEVIRLGGGVPLHAPALRERIEVLAAKAVIGPAIERAVLNDDAGVLGAALYAAGRAAATA